MRPPEDTATMFAFLKQQFYHKTLAYTEFEKAKQAAIIKERNNILAKCIAPQKVETELTTLKKKPKKEKKKGKEPESQTDHSHIAVGGIGET